MDPVNRWFWCGCSDTGEVCILGAVHWSQSVSFRFDSTLKSLVRLPGHHCWIIAVLPMPSSSFWQHYQNFCHRLYVQKNGCYYCVDLHIVCLGPYIRKIRIFYSQRICGGRVYAQALCYCQSFGHQSDPFQISTKRQLLGPRAEFLQQYVVLCCPPERKTNSMLFFNVRWREGDRGCLCDTRRSRPKIAGELGSSGAVPNVEHALLEYKN